MFNFNKQKPNKLTKETLKNRFDELKTYHDIGIVVNTILEQLYQLALIVFVFKHLYIWAGVILLCLYCANLILSFLFQSRQVKENEITDILLQHLGVDEKKLTDEQFNAIKNEFEL